MKQLKRGYLFSNTSQGLIAINIAAIAFGSTALFGKLDVSPVWIVAARAAFAALALLSTSCAKRSFFRVKQHQWKSLLITSLALMVHWVTFFYSVQWAGIALATLTFSTFPMFTIIFEALKGKRHITKIEFLAIGAIIGAVWLLVNVDMKAPDFLAGAIIGIISAMTFAYFGIASKQLGKELSNSAISICQTALVGLLLLPFLIFSEPAPSSSQEWLWLILLGVVATAFMHQLYFYSLKRLSTATCSGFIALEPVYAIAFAAIFFAEPITLLIAVSGILIIGASLLLLFQERRTTLKHEN